MAGAYALAQQTRRSHQQYLDLHSNTLSSNDTTWFAYEDEDFFFSSFDVYSKWWRFERLTDSLSVPFIYSILFTHYIVCVCVLGAYPVPYSTTES